MSNTKKFNSYNFVTGAVDGTLAYDFGNPALHPQEEIYERPGTRYEPRQQEWIKEDYAEQTAAQTEVRSRQGVSPLAFLGSACVVVLLVLMLLAQIQLTSISDTSVALEQQIEQLETERDKLRVEYETVFNLKDVEEYAVGVLGMQEPCEDQIYYLTGVSSADKAVIITNENTDMFSLGLEDIVASVKSYFD